MKVTGKLYIFSGKMGAGKTTYSIKLSEDKNAIKLSEDEWLSTLFPNEITNFDDYIEYSKRLKPLFEKHIHELLIKGVDVVLDFPGNTKRQREWFKKIILDSDCEHELIYLNISNELCLKHLKKRRIEQPERSQFDTEEVFNHVTQYFEEPIPDEGFNIVEIIEE